MLILFLFFPASSASGTLFGFSLTGAAALFMLIWWYGRKSAVEAIDADQASTLKQQNVDELNNTIRRLQEDLQKSTALGTASQKPKVLSETKVFAYPLSASQKKIGLITGNIQGVKNVDIWVNSENNNMQMSRWYEGTISGMIRYLGAKKG